MHHASLFDAEELTEAVNIYFRNLQISGVLYGKILPEPEQNKFRRRTVNSKTRLDRLETKTVLIDGSLSLEVPCILVEVATAIRQNDETVGIFRVNGSEKRMNKIKTQLNKGRKLCDLNQSWNVHDVTGILLSFLKELQRPLLYGSYQDVLLSCLNNDKLNNDPQLLEEAVLMACLPLPRIHLDCLTYLIRLLSDLASREGRNKMTAYNLASGTAQSIMNPPAHVNLADRMKDNIRVIEILIKKADSIGFVPRWLQKKLRPPVGTTLTSELSSEKLDSDTLGLKKRSRSRSLTGAEGRRPLPPSFHSMLQLDDSKKDVEEEVYDRSNTECASMSRPEMSSAPRRGQRAVVSGCPQVSATVTMPAAIEHPRHTQFRLTSANTNRPITRSQTLAASSSKGWEQYTSKSPVKEQKTVSQACTTSNSEQLQDIVKFSQGKIQSSSHRDFLKELSIQNAGLVQKRTEQFNGKCLDAPDRPHHRSYYTPKVTCGRKKFNHARRMLMPSLEQRPKYLTSRKSHSLQKSPKIASPRKQPERSAKSQNRNPDAAKRHTHHTSSSTKCQQSKEISKIKTSSVSHERQNKPVLSSQQMDVAQNCQESTYIDCTETNDDLQLVISSSPLKDCNRPTTSHTPTASTLKRKCTVKLMKMLAVANSATWSSPQRTSQRIASHKEKQLKKQF